ncbi:hypothetical protein BLNAU_15546 [Blattamonas nauphoetae]|uniref:HAT C-terminal dimerisation domain-containing protein n=1 Tax=Blattamonas nauphoetae TaxID=2049346 RepID=A0ABQ9XD01_9EUKA|nr:hypothetical protein BLNAU_15546 [Blattamonas nauphoetae]
MGSIVVDGGKIGDMHIFLAIFVTPHVGFEPLLINASFQETELNTQFYSSFADECLQICRNHRIQPIAFVADNAVPLQNGLNSIHNQPRDSDNIDPLLQPLLPVSPHPIVGRCHNHLLDLAWNDSKKYAPHISILLETLRRCAATFPVALSDELGSKPPSFSPTRWLDEMYQVSWFGRNYPRFNTLSVEEEQFFLELVELLKILQPLFHLKNQLGSRTCNITHVFPLLMQTISTILQNLLHSPTRWKDMGSIIIDCLFVRFFCNTASSLMLVAFALTKQGRDSYHEQVSILPKPEDIDLNFVPIVLDEDDRVPVDPIEISDTSDDLSEVERRERIRRSKGKKPNGIEQPKHTQTSYHHFQKPIVPVNVCPPIVAQKRQFPTTMTTIESHSQDSEEKDDPTKSIRPRQNFPPLLPISILLNPPSFTKGQLPITLFTIPKQNQSSFTKPLSFPIPVKPLTINKANQANGLISSPTNSHQTPQETSLNHRPRPQQTQPLFPGIVSQIEYTPPHRHLHQMRTGIELPSIVHKIANETQGQNQDVQSEDFPRTPAFSVLSCLHTFHHEIAAGFRKYSTLLLGHTNPSLEQQFDVWINREETISFEISDLSYRQFWRRYKDRANASELGDFALSIGTVAVSEIECERYFSHLGKIYSKSRRNLHREQVLAELSVAFHTTLDSRE